MERVFTLDGHQYDAQYILSYGKRLEVLDAYERLRTGEGITKGIFEILQGCEGHNYTVHLTLLEELLVPQPGSPSVRDAFDNASEEEVRAVARYFVDEIARQDAIAGMYAKEWEGKLPPPDKEINWDEYIPKHLQGWSLIFEDAKAACDQYPTSSNWLASCSLPYDQLILRSFLRTAFSQAVEDNTPQP